MTAFERQLEGLLSDGSALGWPVWVFPAPFDVHGMPELISPAGRVVSPVNRLVATPNTLPSNDPEPTPDAERDIAGMVPGMQLAALLTSLDLNALSPTGLVDTAAGWERIISWATAQQLTVLAEAARPGRVAALDSCAAMAQARMLPLDFDDVAAADPESAATVIAEEATKITAATIGPLIGLTRHTITERVNTAIDLINHLPATFTALSRGDCDLRRAYMISHRTPLMNPTARARADHVLAAAVTAGENSGKLRHTIDKTIAHLDPTTYTNQHRKAIAARTVTYRPGTDGMGILTATLRADDALTIYHFLATLGEHAAKADTNESDPLPDQHTTPQTGLETLPPRTPGACRADVLTDLIHTLINTHHNTPNTADPHPALAPHPPSTPAPTLRPLPQLNITLTLETLAHITNDPAWLHSYGHIPADYAQYLAASAATITTTLLDNCGTHLDQGTTIRIPHQKLKTHIHQRDHTCRAPGCNQPATQSDIDHQIPWQPHNTGGKTCPCNLAALCRTHHLLKHRAGITITHHPNHTITWKTPTGHTHQTQPHEWPHTNQPPPY